MAMGSNADFSTTGRAAHNRPRKRRPPQHRAATVRERTELTIEAGVRSLTVAALCWRCFLRALHSFDLTRWRERRYKRRRCGSEMLSASSRFVPAAEAARAGGRNGTFTATRNSTPFIIGLAAA